MPIFFTKKSCNRGVEPPPQMPLTVNVGKQKGEPKLVQNPRPYTLCHQKFLST